MLQVARLDVFIGSVQVLDRVALDIPSGMMCGLVGRNGAGKTSLMRSIMGALPTRTGGIQFDGVDLLAQRAHQRAALGIGYMPEDRKLVPEFTAEENVLLPAWSTDMRQPQSRLDWIYGLIPEVRDFRARRANQLSGGQGKMVALARAMMCGNKLLLLDEPFEGVAPALARRLAQILANLKGEGLSVLLADSNAKHIGGLVDRTFVIERGQVTAE